MLFSTRHMYVNTSDLDPKPHVKLMKSRHSTQPQNREPHGFTSKGHTHAPIPPKKTSTPHLATTSSERERERERESRTSVLDSIWRSWSASQCGRITSNKLMSVCPTSPRCDRLSIALRTQSSTKDNTMVTHLFSIRKPRFPTNYHNTSSSSSSPWNNQHLFATTNPLNFLHFRANPALQRSLKQELQSPSLRRTRNMICRRLGGGNGGERQEGKGNARSCFCTLNVVLTYTVVSTVWI
jgi:hypothetical protein